MSAKRSIKEIARDICHAWPKPYFGARPYLAAMLTLDGPNDAYGADSAKSVVLYFLSNAATFKGPEARTLKQELRDLVGAP